jgi:hypothetical protein
MERNDDKEALMRAYLLGDLPEADAREIEELYFAEDEHFDGFSVGEADLVDAYVDARLTPQERTLFERNYLTSDERRRHVDFARQLVVAAGRRDHRSFRERLGVIRAALRTLIAEPRWAIATAMVCVALIIAWNVSVHRVGRPAPSGVDATSLLILKSSPSPETVFSPDVLHGKPAPKPRAPEPADSEDGPITGAAAPEEFAVPPQAEYVGLVLAVSPGACRDSFTAELHEYYEDGRLLWRDTVRCSTPALDRVTLQIPAHVLTSDREYTVTLQRKREAVNLYSFRVRSH